MRFATNLGYLFNTQRYLKAVAAASGAWEGILGTVLKGSPVYLEWALPRADAWSWLWGSNVGSCHISGGLYVVTTTATLLLLHNSNNNNNNNNNNHNRNFVFVSTYAHRFLGSNLILMILTLPQALQFSRQKLCSPSSLPMDHGGYVNFKRSGWLRPLQAAGVSRGARRSGCLHLSCRWLFIYLWINMNQEHTTSHQYGAMDAAIF